MVSGPDSASPGDSLTPQSDDTIASIRETRQHYVINDAIGQALRAHYRTLAEAPLPDRFLILLAELEAKDARNAT